MLDFVDEPLDQISLGVEHLIVRDGLRSRAARGDYGLSFGFCNSSAKAIRVIALVGKQVLKGKTADQLLGLADVMRLARSQNEANRIAEGIDADVDLCAQAAARAPNRLIFAAPLLAPAACWCARTTVESMIRYSKSGSSASALKRRSQTPFLAHRRKRWNTLFQLPNSPGKSRHGAPLEPTKVQRPRTNGCPHRGALYLLLSPE
jgi:hypothetical protein